MSEYFTIQFSDKERDTVLKALASFRDEYFNASNEVKSLAISEQLRENAREYARVYDRMANLITRTEMDAQVSSLVSSGKMIEAIKLVRATTLMGLKEAKVHVESVRDKQQLVEQGNRGY